VSVKQLLADRHRHLLKHGGDFTFSMTYSPEAIEEIEQMGESFTKRYQYTIANIPKFVGRIICISLKDMNKT
jgi:thiamine monophosphate kinase